MGSDVDEQWLTFVGVDADFRNLIEDAFTSDGALVGDSVEKLAHRVGAHLVLIESSTAERNLGELARWTEEPNVYTVALAESADADTYVQLMRAGASAVADVVNGVEHIAAVTAAALRHDCLLPRSVLRNLLDRPDLDRLSDASIQIVQCLGRGMNAKQIAALLNVSGRTARRRIHNLYLQLGVSDAAAAVARATERGLLNSSEDSPQNSPQGSSQE